MKLIKQTIIIANDDTKKQGYNVPEGFTGRYGYFLSEQELRELLENTFDAGIKYPKLSLGEAIKYKKEYINNLLKEE